MPTWAAGSGIRRCFASRRSWNGDRRGSARRPARAVGESRLRNEDPPLCSPDMLERLVHAPDEDSALVARVRAGDEGAFQALYLAHHDGLWRFAYAYVR